MDNIYKKVAIQAALKSGLLIKRSLGKIHKISYKGIDNIVTDVDKLSERMIIKSILSAFPGHSVLSEEDSPISGAAPYRWLIDPLDGTTNFAHSFPFFAVSIALEMSGEPILGVVYDPMRDELFHAQTGRGAYLNKKKIQVSRAARLSDGFIATGFSYGRQGKNENVKNFRNFLLNSLAIRRAGSAALDLCYVACGRFDGFWEMNLYPWDSAAGMVIVKEAKGLVTRFDGKEFTPYMKDILASNGYIHKQMIRILSET